MESNSLAVLQQLTANPQLLSQLQSLLALLSPRQDNTNNDNSGIMNMAGPTTLPSTTRSPPSLSSPLVTTGGFASPALTPLPASGDPHPKQQPAQWRESHQTVASTSRGSTQTSTFPHAPRETKAHNGVSLQRYEQVIARCRQLEEQLEEKSRELAGTTPRVGHLEKEVTRLSRRVEQLIGVVEQQKRVMEESEAKYSLELAEVKHNYELELQSKTAAYDEALQKLMNAQRLVLAAKQYEQTVSSNTGSGGSAGQWPSVTSTPVNRSIYLQTGSSVKQDAATPQTFLHDTNSKTKKGIVEREACDDDDTLTTRMVATKRERDDANSSTTPTAHRKRRTPRTPSLTGADRVAAAAGLRSTSAGKPTAASYKKTTSHSVKMEMDSPQVRPTAAFTEECHTVKPHTPCGVTISSRQATSTITEALARHHHRQQQHQEQQREAVSTKSAESRFVAHYGTPLPPVPVPTSMTTSVTTLSRTPRQRGGHNGHPRGGFQSGQRSGTSSVVGGPTRSPSPINPKRGADQPRCFVITSLSDEERKRVRAAVAALGQNGVVLDSEYEDPPPFTATHIVLRGPPRSMKALCGVVAAKWLVQPEYIYASQSAGFWLDEYDEGGLRCFPPPLKCQRFLLTMPDGVVKEKLQQVIEYGGGEVVGTGTSTTKNNTNLTRGDNRTFDQGVVVIASGDELLRFAIRVE